MSQLARRIKIWQGIRVQRVCCYEEEGKPSRGSFSLARDVLELPRSLADFSNGLPLSRGPHPEPEAKAAGSKS